MENISNMTKEEIKPIVLKYLYLTLFTIFNIGLSVKGIIAIIDYSRTEGIPLVLTWIGAIGWIIALEIIYLAYAFKSKKSLYDYFFYEPGDFKAFISWCVIAALQFAFWSIMSACSGEEAILYIILIIASIGCAVGPPETIACSYGFMSVALILLGMICHCSYWLLAGLILIPLDLLCLGIYYVGHYKGEKKFTIGLMLQYVIFGIYVILGLITILFVMKGVVDLFNNIDVRPIQDYSGEYRKLSTMGYFLCIGEGMIAVADTICLFIGFIIIIGRLYVKLYEDENVSIFNKKEVLLGVLSLVGVPLLYAGIVFGINWLVTM